MRENPFLLMLIFYSLFLFLGESTASSTQSKNANQVYIVYMGAADSTNGTLRKDHVHVLNTVLRK